MLTDLTLHNFKSWRDTSRARVAPITAIFGANSSGKSSLLQSLLLLKQTVESADQRQVLNFGDEKSPADLGSFDDIISGHDLSARLSMSVAWDTASFPTVGVWDINEQALVPKDHQIAAYGVDLIWAPGKPEGLGRILVDRLMYRLNDEEYSLLRANEDGTEYGLVLPGSREGQTIPSIDTSWLPPPIKCYGFPDRRRPEYGGRGLVIAALERSFEQLFERTFYLGPLREPPNRAPTIWSGAEPADVGWRGENTVLALLASRVRELTVSRGSDQPRQTVEERVASALRELNLIDSFVTRPIVEGGNLFQVWIRRLPELPEVLLPDVGFGISQVLPVITLCYYVPSGSTILLEQPEIHLHPAVQMDLADVLIDAARNHGVQIIVESHSEHLLRRLLRRVAEERLDPDFVAMYFCSIAQGKSRLTPLELDQYGTIRNWPDNFFGDEMGELGATVDAALTRKIAAGA